MLGDRIRLELRNRDTGNVLAAEVSVKTQGTDGTYRVDDVTGEVVRVVDNGFHTLFLADQEKFVQSVVADKYPGRAYQMAVQNRNGTWVVEHGMKRVVYVWVYQRGSGADPVAVEVEIPAAYELAPGDKIRGWETKAGIESLIRVLGGRSDSVKRTLKTYYITDNPDKFEYDMVESEQARVIVKAFLVARPDLKFNTLDAYYQTGKPGQYGRWLVEYEPEVGPDVDVLLAETVEGLKKVYLSPIKTGRLDNLSLESMTAVEQVLNMFGIDTRELKHDTLEFTRAD